MASSSGGCGAPPYNDWWLTVHTICQACSSGCSRLRKAINQSLTAAEHDVESNVQAATRAPVMSILTSYRL